MDGYSLLSGRHDALKQQLDAMDAQRQAEDEARLSRLMQLSEGASMDGLPGAGPRVQSRASLAQRNIAGMQGMGGPSAQELFDRERDPEFLQRRAMALGFDRTGNRSRQIGGADVGDRVASSSGLHGPAMREFSGPSFNEWQGQEMDSTGGGLSVVNPSKETRVGSEEMANRRSDARDARQARGAQMDSNRHSFYENQDQSRGLAAMLNGIDPRQRGEVITAMQERQAQIELARLQAESNKYIADNRLAGDVYAGGPEGAILPPGVSDFVGSRLGGISPASMSGAGDPGPVGPGVPPPPPVGEDGTRPIESVANWLASINPASFPERPNQGYPTAGELRDILNDFEDSPMFGESSVDQEYRSKVYSMASQALKEWYGIMPEFAIEDTEDGVPPGAPGTPTVPGQAGPGTAAGKLARGLVGPRVQIPGGTDQTMMANDAIGNAKRFFGF